MCSSLRLEFVIFNFDLNEELEETRTALTATIKTAGGSHTSYVTLDFR